MLKLAIVGTHGTGKSTLIHRLAYCYRSEGKTVAIVEEAARDCPHKLGTVQSQRWIWYEHCRREDKAFASGADIVLVDRSRMDNLCYLRNILNQTPCEHGENSFTFFHAVAKVFMGKYDYVLRLPINEDYITNANDDIRPRDLEYAHEIDRIFDEMVDLYVNCDDIDSLP